MILPLIHMKHLMLFGLFAGASALVAGVVSDQAIEFSKEDLSGGSYEKRWTINGLDSGEDTPVWSIVGMGLDRGVRDGRIMTTNALAEEDEVVWKVTVPSDLEIKEFTWAVQMAILDGAPDSDDFFVWEYSTDGNEWKELCKRKNRAPEDPKPLYLPNQSYTEMVRQKGVSQLLIRARRMEGPQANDRSYFCIFSKFPVGGESDASYISVVTKPIR